MAPGPITAAILGKGSTTPYAGALIAIGHGFVEVPLMIAILFGMQSLMALPYVQLVVSVLGAFFLMVMAVGMLRALRDPEVGALRRGESSLATGVLLTLGNPYFFVWWATVGAALVLRSAAFGIWGFVAMATAHWMCDFVWDYFLSVMSFKGGQFFGKRFQKVVLLVCGSLLVVFAIKLLVDAAGQVLA